MESLTSRRALWVSGYRKPSDIRKKLHELNVEAVSSTPQQAADLLANDVRRWGEVITRAKIPLQ